MKLEAEMFRAFFIVLKVGKSIGINYFRKWNERHSLWLVFDPRIPRRFGIK